jgi:hypothetical protein
MYKFLWENVRLDAPAVGMEACHDVEIGQMKIVMLSRDAFQER